MRTFLDRMRDLKLKEISQRQKIISEKDLYEQLENLEASSTDKRQFSSQLRRQPEAGLALIAEVKARAPGRENVSQLDPETVVDDYQNGGAKAISVLTDESWFGGSLETLAMVSARSKLPLLHKEFIVSPYQLLEGKVRGASAALILAYYFQERELRQILKAAHEIGVEAVLECSLEEELPRALNVNPDILMINNRAIAAIPEEPIKTYDLGNVDVSLDWWQRFSDLREWKKQEGKLLISASCINSSQDIQKLMSIPCDAGLIGNAAMTAPDRIKFLKSLQNINQ